MKTYDELVDRFPWAKGRGKEYEKGCLGLVLGFCKKAEERYRVVNKELDFEIFCIKEKYGELCLQYCKVGSIDLEDLERKYEKLSIMTYEICGEKGMLRDDNGWLHVACDSCYKSPL